MDVSLRPDLAQFVAEKIKAGQYASADDVVNEALEILKDREEFSSAHKSYLRREVQRGLDQLDARKSADFDAHKIIHEERARRTGAK